MQSCLIWQPCSVYVGVSVFFFLTKYMFLCLYICGYRVCSSLWMTAQALVISNQEHEGIRVPFTTPALPCYFSLPFIHPSTHPSSHHKHSITLLLPLSFIHSVELRLLGRLCLPVRLSGMIGWSRDFIFSSLLHTWKPSWLALISNCDCCAACTFLWGSLVLDSHTEAKLCWQPRTTKVRQSSQLLFIGKRRHSLVSKASRPGSRFVLLSHNAKSRWQENRTSVLNELISFILTEFVQEDSRNERPRQDLNQGQRWERVIAQVQISAITAYILRDCSFFITVMLQTSKLSHYAFSFFFLIANFHFNF